MNIVEKIAITRRNKMTTSFIAGLLLVLIVIAILPFIGAWRIVGAGKVGVVTRFGAVQRVVNPGFVLKLPIVDGMVILETRIQKYEVNASAASKDLQDVNSVIALNFHLVGDKAVDIFQDVGTNYRERIIDPAMQEVFKEATAKFSATDLIEKRAEVKAVAEKSLKERLAKQNIILVSLNIVDFDFSEEFNQAIESKQVAEQNKQRAKLEADALVIKSQGQADAQKKLREEGALSPEFLDFLAVEKWDGILPTVVGGAVPFVNIPN